MVVSDFLSLPLDRAAPAHARRYVAATGAAWNIDLLDLALLVASELVTNAVVHGGPPIGLIVRALSGGVGIEVSDGGVGAPVLADHRAGADEVHGRGLFLIDQFADRWGSHLRQGRPGKTVRVELGVAA